MKNIYIKNEAKKGFMNWTKQGLKYLQKLNIKDRVIEYKIKKNLEKLKRN
jgi:hypothetical protein